MSDSPVYMMGPWGGQVDACAVSSLSCPCCFTIEKLLILVWSSLLSKARAVLVSIPNLLQRKMTLTKVH